MTNLRTITAAVSFILVGVAQVVGLMNCKEDCDVLVKQDTDLKIDTK